MEKALNARRVLGWTAWLAVAALGCGPGASTGPDLVAKNTIRQAPAKPVVRVRQLVATAVNTAPQTNAAPIAGAVVDARALIITSDGTDGAFGAIEATLQFLGTPFDVLNATTGPTLTADMLASGTHGKYDAIFLDTGNLSVSGGSAFSTDEWNTLTTYEAQFGVRRVSLYTSPTASYGLTDNGEVDPSKTPVTMTCTPAGTSLFVGMNCAQPMVVNQGWIYPATATDSATTPLLVDASGNIYAATRTYSDGREALALTFAQASYYNSYRALAYGLVHWATRGVFIGERHVYAVPQLDDLFLFSDMYTGGTDRILDSDLQALAAWQGAKQAQPQFAGFRVAFACNGYGSASKQPGDPLTAKAIALGSTFAWINHTWDHQLLDPLSYADVLNEFTKNDTYLKGLPLSPYATISAVTPNISGLSSADAMQAIHDAGIRYLVSDTSVSGQANPSPNIGIWNALQPTVLEIPRIPTDLYYDVENPTQWIPQYESLKMIASIDYPTIIDQQSNDLAGYMLEGNKDPWMFHQLNAKNYDGAGHSLVSDLLDAAFAKYAAASTFPVQSPTQDQLAQIFINRMTLQSAGASATIQPGSSITVSVASAATVPLTGVCTPGAESYAGQTISYLNLSAGQSVTLSLTGCNAGTGGTGGMGGGAGGMTGTAGASGLAGAGGMSGPGSGGVAGSGTAGATGAGGAPGTGGSAGSGGSVAVDMGGTAGGAATGGTAGSAATGGTAGTAGLAGNGGLAGADGAAGRAGAPGIGGAAGNGEGQSGGQSGAGGEFGRGGAGGAAGGHAGSETGAAGHGGHGGGAAGYAGSGPVPLGGSGCDCAVGQPASGPAALLLTLVGGAIGTGLRRRRSRRP